MEAFRLDIHREALPGESEARERLFYMHGRYRAPHHGPAVLRSNLTCQLHIQVAQDSEQSAAGQ
ncbi:hypothetical protein EON65_26170 [archaeon]|nr:MAG: hypothetical protein EON65_26170 [archaeon]